MLSAASERRNAAAAPTSSESIGRWSGARSSTIASIVGKPAIERAGSVRTGPAEAGCHRRAERGLAHAHEVLVGHRALAAQVSHREDGAACRLHQRLGMAGS